jgi:hypothetical protein
VKNGYTTKSKIYVQCNPHQNFNVILHRDRKINPKAHRETQKTSNNENMLRKKSNARGITIPDLKLDYRSIIIKKHGTCTKTGMKTIKQNM